MNSDHFEPQLDVYSHPGFALKLDNADLCLGYIIFWMVYVIRVDVTESKDCCLVSNHFFDTVLGMVP